MLVIDSEVLNNVEADYKSKRQKVYDLFGLMAKLQSGFSKRFNFYTNLLENLQFLFFIIATLVLFFRHIFALMIFIGNYQYNTNK